MICGLCSGQQQFNLTKFINNEVNIIKEYVNNKVDIQNSVVYFASETKLCIYSHKCTLKIVHFF